MWRCPSLRATARIRLRAGAKLGEILPFPQGTNSQILDLFVANQRKIGYFWFKVAHFSGHFGQEEREGLPPPRPWLRTCSFLIHHRQHTENKLWTERRLLSALNIIKWFHCMLLVVLKSALFSACLNLFLFSHFPESVLIDNRTLKLARTSIV